MKRKLVRGIYTENLIKNGLVLLVLIGSYPLMRYSLFHSPLAQDKSGASALLVSASILAVTACFGNFAFTYEKLAVKSFRHRLLAHLTTGLLMLIIGFSLELSALLTEIITGPFPLLTACWILLYIASILYDFWDLQRINISSD